MESTPKPVIADRRLARSACGRRAGADDSTAQARTRVVVWSGLRGTRNHARCAPMAVALIGSAM